VRTEGPPLSETTIAALSSTGRTDYVGIHAVAGAGEAETVQVVAHVANGLLIEVEMFAGEGVAVSAPPADRLHDFETN
jgi:hypothetical protein